jgi:hypothetical protein
MVCFVSRVQSEGTMSEIYASTVCSCWSSTGQLLANCFIVFSIGAVDQSQR